jgi:8-oxo-dGTP pyrophosphatase MutT (NUDIX family)
MIREFSAGGIVFKPGGLVLIRKPAPNPGFKGNLGWNFPKGWIDDADEGKKPGPKTSGQEKASETDLEVAALREVREEAGVEAKIVKKLPTIRFFYKNSEGNLVMKFVTFFRMEWVADLPEGWGWETGEAKWVSLDEAKKLLINKSERELLEKVEEV